MVLIPIAGLVLFVFFIWLINKLIDMKEKREREKRRQEEQKAWMALSPEERKRITKEREKQIHHEDYGPLVYFSHLLCGLRVLGRPSICNRVASLPGQSRSPQSPL